MSDIQQWQKDSCEWCAKGYELWGEGLRQHIPGVNEDLSYIPRPCTAPTALEYIATLREALEPFAMMNPGEIDIDAVRVAMRHARAVLAPKEPI
jgi:hypothetical protein